MPIIYAHLGPCIVARIALPHEEHSSEARASAQALAAVSPVHITTTEQDRSTNILILLPPFGSTDPTKVDIDLNFITINGALMCADQ
jgi:predicted RNA methylase